uniref:putative DNA polymerase-like protein n=1 Tax=Periconia digitata TaxID=1303443 RepID=UPI0023AB40E6|nr:putative DNA polymerase-like protein [Periconia digitata]WCA44869.1 putative DNA polymerase-like protein [Periconia digitata]
MVELLKFIDLMVRIYIIMTLIHYTPFTAFQPMPGLDCHKVTYYKQIEDIDNLFGYFYCVVNANNAGYLGLLPVRNDKGIHFPVGCWEGWYFSEEIKFVKENGYSIKVLKGYTFNK